MDEAERWYESVLEKALKEEEARFRLGYLRLQPRGIPRRHGGLRRLLEVPSAMARSAGEPGAGIQRSGRSQPGGAHLREDAGSRPEIRRRSSRSRRYRHPDIRLGCRAQAACPPHRTRGALGGSPVQRRSSCTKKRASPTKLRSSIGKPSPKAGYAGSAAEPGTNPGSAGKSAEARACWTRGLEAEPDCFSIAAALAPGAPRSPYSPPAPETTSRTARRG